MRIILCLLYVVAAWKWGKWRNWKEYYPTFLFVLASNYFSSILTYNHTLWRFSPTFLLQNHTLVEFCITLIAYPAAVLLFLSRYPEGSLIKQAGWIVFWTGLFTSNEVMNIFLGKITYDNGWSLGWSAAFDLVMFSILRVHYLNPGLAWVLSAILTTFIWIHFGFSLQELK